MVPVVSVVMSVYNGELHLKHSIESILSQTLINFELIIINDGSTDNSLNIIKNYMEVDNRITLIDRENKGLVASLNEGINIAKGKFIARMDADDICSVDRLQEQVNHMEKNNIDLCGSFVEVINKDGESIKIRPYPVNHNDITITALFYSPFAHPSVMFRKNIFNNLQYEDYLAEDYKLWCDIILKGFKTANLPKPLLKYRVHDEQITQIKRAKLSECARGISKNFADNLGPQETSLVNQKNSILKNANLRKFRHFHKDLQKLIFKYNASKQLNSKILLWLYERSQPKTPWTASYYLVVTNNYSRDKKFKLELFLKSILGSRSETSLIRVLKKYYRIYF